MGGSHAGRGSAHGGTAVRPSDAACCAAKMSTTRSSTAQPTADRRRPTRPICPTRLIRPTAAGCRARWSSFLLGSVVFIMLACAAVFLTVQQLTGNIPRVPNVFSGLDNANRPSPVVDRVSFLIMGTDSRQARATRRHRAHAGPGRRRPEPQRHAGLGGVDPPRRLGRHPRPRAGQDQQRVRPRWSRHCSSRPSSSSPTTASTTSPSSTTPGSSTWSTPWAASTSRAGTSTGPRRCPTSARAPPTPPSTATGSAGSRPPSGRWSTRPTADGLLGDPLKLFRLLDSLSKAVSVDETLTSGGMDGLGLQMRGLRTATTQFAVAPVRAIGREGGRSVIYLDEPRSEQLWNAVRDGTVDGYLKQFPGDSSGPRGEVRANGPAASSEREGDERNHPGRRRRHPAAPDHPRGVQAAAAGLRQADDLLPAVGADAGRHPGDPA